MDQFLEIGREFYLLRSDERDFHRNIYLKRFIQPELGQKNMIFDPGTRLDLPRLLPALDKMIGGVKNLDFIFLSHQDPDVTANVPMLLASAPRAVIIASIDTWRLIRMYGIEPKRFLAVESFQKKQVHIRATRHSVQFVAAHFAHFKGAMMLYDVESGILFSGDFMGGVNTQRSPGIFADEDSWPGIALFHQIYMPSKTAIEETVIRIGELPALPRLIAPQHGNLIRGEQVRPFLERILTLDVGLDLIKGNKNQREMTLLAANSFMDLIKELHPDIHARINQAISQPGDFTTLVHYISGTFVDLKVSPEIFWGSFGNICRQLLGDSQFQTIENILHNTLREFGLTPLADSAAVPDIPEPLMD